jgi:hypothetical protein
LAGLGGSRTALVLSGESFMPRDLLVPVGR